MLQLTDNIKKIELVVEDHNKFKIKLGIGEKAYGSLRAADAIQRPLKTLVFSAVGGLAASTPLAASTFFSSGGILALVGLGTAATPIGWVIAAAAGSGTIYWGISKATANYRASRVDAVPKFINTPLDFLGATVFDMIGGLALKFAHLSGGIDQSERDWIVSYFINEWGLSKEYCYEALLVLEPNVTSEDSKLKEMTQALNKFKAANPDCDANAVRKTIIDLLNEVMRADGKITELEEILLDVVDGELATGKLDKLKKRMRAAFSCTGRN